MKASVTLFKSRTLKNGEYSVKVRIFEGGKYKHYDTGVSCKEANWNSNKCRVSSKDIAYKEKNAKIDKVFKVCTGESENTTPKRKDNEVSFYNLIALKKEKAQAINTKKLYITLEIYLKEHYPTLPLSSISQQWFDDFIAGLKRNKSITMANQHIRCFLSVYNFSIKNGIVTTPTFFEYNRKDFAAYAPKDRMLNGSELNLMLYAYRQTQQNYNYLAEYTKEDKALMLWILHFAFQGLAPVDMANIRLRDLSIETLNTIDYNPIKAQEQANYEEWYNTHNERIQVVTATLFRHKTRERIDIATDYESIKPILDYFMKNKTQDDYLIDCFNKDKEYAPQRLNYYYFTKAENLNKYISKINQLPIFSNKGIEVKRITYYSARHTFINKASSLNVEYDTIRKMIGHKRTTLEQYYIADATKIEQAKVMRTILKDFCNITKR